jgi:hypothetical protein
VKRHRSLAVAATLGALAASLAPLSAHAQTACGEHSAHTSNELVDTLPRFENVTAATRDTAGHILAAKDALIGRSNFSPPLVVVKYQREGTAVLIDLRADSLPTVKWNNAGGTVRIRADGCRIILARHN